jgi:predicted nucleotidyltransferase
MDVTTLAEQEIEELVRRVVEVADPEMIILFGSAARGTMGPDSDLDLLVVKGGEYDRREVWLRIDRALRSLARPADVILATPWDIERYKDSFCLVYYPALREGRVIYDALRAR